MMTEAAKLSKKATDSKHIQTAIMTTKTHSIHNHHRNLERIPHCEKQFTTNTKTENAKVTSGGSPSVSQSVSS